MSLQQSASEHAGGVLTMDQQSARQTQPKASDVESTDSLDSAGMAFVRDSQLSVPGATLTFKDLAFTTQVAGAQKVILEPCSGHFEPGQLVAIMGPSGSGKTTLLDMLAMKKTAPYAGQVWLNGHPRDPSLFQRVASYVGQEEHMPAHWTVREALHFNASLKRQSAEGSKRVNQMVDALLETFGLSGVADTYIGGVEVRGISGGQRRRVSLARGVVAQASLLLCDEPTSGLSATDAELCVKALRAIAKRMGVLVLVVIHQPRKEVAELFDTLVLLASNPGRMAYCGPMSCAPSYMQSCGHPVPVHSNPTDIYLDMLTPGIETDVSDELVAYFNTTQRPLIDAMVATGSTTQGMRIQDMLVDAQETLAPSKRPRVGPYAATFAVQLKTLLRRKVRITLRNPAAVGMQIGMPVMMGVVLGSVFQGIGTHDFGIGTIQFVYILLTMLSLQSLPLMPLLIDERTYMKLETSERLYNEWAYILTTLCITVPLSLLGASLQTLIIYSFTGLDYDFLPCVFFWTVFLFFFFDALFQCVSAIAPDAQQAQTMATPFLVIFMLFNGVVVTRATAPHYFQWIFEVSPTGYAMQAILMRMRESAGSIGQATIDALGYSADENFKGAGIIMGMVVVLRLLQVVAIKYLNNIQK